MLIGEALLLSCFRRAGVLLEAACLPHAVVRKLAFFDNSRIVRMLQLTNRSQRIKKQKSSGSRRILFFWRPCFICKIWGSPRYVPERFAVACRGHAPRKTKKIIRPFMRDVYFNAQSRSKSRELLSALLWVIESLLTACVVVTLCEAFISGFGHPGAQDAQKHIGALRSRFYGFFVRLFGCPFLLFVCACIRFVSEIKNHPRSHRHRRV